MGYIAFINGHGLTVQFDDDGVHLVEQHVKCSICDIDKVYKNGKCFHCDRILNNNDDV